MQWNEFMELQQCLVAWFRVFQQYDSDRSGFIEANELVNVITNLYGECACNKGVSGNCFSKQQNDRPTSLLSFLLVQLVMDVHV